MENQFEQFIKERQYLTNVTPATVEWYRQSLAWLGIESPSEADLKSFVMRMREKGLKPSGCNCRIRAVNAYLKWSSSPLRVPKLKEPQLILPTFTVDQIKRLIAHKPHGQFQRRLHLLVLILLDTGCRISEALDLRLSDCDLDNMLMTSQRKGSEGAKGTLLISASQSTVPLHARNATAPAVAEHQTGVQTGSSHHGSGR